MLDMNSDNYFGLNPVGACLVDSIQEGHVLAAAIDRVVERFDVEPEIAQADAEELVDSLLSKGLIESIAGDLG